MKIHLKSILTAKWRIVLAASMMAIVIIGVVLVYLYAVKPAPDTNSSITPHEIRPRQVAAKPRRSSIRTRVTVLTPVNVVNDAFKGYELNKDSDAEALADDEQKAGNSTAEMVSEELAGQQPHTIKTAPAGMKQERAKERETKPGDPAAGVSLSAHSPAAGKDEAAVLRTVDQDEGVKHLNERLDEARLSEAGRQKMIQSYLELRKVLPEKEAQKMIMWKIVHEKK